MAACVACSATRYKTYREFTLSVVRVFETTSRVKIREALAIGLVISGSLQPVAQATVGDGLSFDPFSFCQDGGPAPEGDVSGGEIVDALVVAAVIVVFDEGGDLGFEIAGQEVIFQ